MDLRLGMYATMLDGPVRVLNVMVKKDVARAEVHVCTGDALTVAPKGKQQFILQLLGTFHCEPVNQASFQLQAGQFLLWESGADLRFSLAGGTEAGLLLAYIIRPFITIADADLNARR